MSYFYDVIVIFLLFVVLFVLPHSLLASNKVKQKIKEKAGRTIAFYRLFYNIVSILTFLLFYKLSPKPRLVIYDLDYPFDILMVVLQFISLIGLFWAASHICVKEFLGINQVKRYLLGSYNDEDLDESSALTFSGPYAFSRHPIYLFSMLFLIFRPSMDLFYLTMLLCIIGYFYVGSIYEEKKLVEKFGELYTDYQKNVSRIFPLKLKRYKIED